MLSGNTVQILAAATAIPTEVFRVFSQSPQAKVPESTPVVSRSAHMTMLNNICSCVSVVTYQQTDHWVPKPKSTSLI